MRRISLDARMALDAASSDEIEVALMIINHPDFEEPIRLSTDPTERISVDPLIYGTRSTWCTTDGSPFLYAAMSAQLPGDQDDATPQAGLVLENVDNDIAALLRSSTDLATVDLAVVLASSPNLPEFEFFGLKLMTSEGDAGEVTLNLSRQPITSEPYPADRMTRARLPGLHR